MRMNNKSCALWIPHIRNNWSKDIFCASIRETRITSNFEPRNLPQPQKAVSRQTHTKMSRRKLLFKLMRQQTNLWELLNVPQTLRVLKCKLNQQKFNLNAKSFSEEQTSEKDKHQKKLFLKKLSVENYLELCKNPWRLRRKI